MFQLTEPGEYFADIGFYVEYGQSTTRGAYAASNELTFGPVIAKDIGRTTHTINLFFTRQLGPDQTSQGLDFSYAWQGRWNLLGAAVAGDRDLRRHRHVGQHAAVFATATAGRAGRGRPAQPERSWSRPGGQLKYEVGWLFGATPATARGTLRWRLELEIPF